MLGEAGQPGRRRLVFALQAGGQPCGVDDRVGGVGGLAAVAAPEAVMDPQLAAGHTGPGGRRLGGSAGSGPPVAAAADLGPGPEVAELLAGHAAALGRLLAVAVVAGRAAPEGVVVADSAAVDADALGALGAQPTHRVPSPQLGGVVVGAVGAALAVALITARAVPEGGDPAQAVAVDAGARHAGQTGGIERPLATLGAGRVAAGLGVAATGVVSTSIRSPGEQSSAVHSAARVDSLTWAGCLVSNADTLAEDSCSPARSANSRRNCAPVHTSRWAAAIRSRHFTSIPASR